MTVFVSAATGAATFIVVVVVMLMMMLMFMFMLMTATAARAFFLMSVFMFVFRHNLPLYYTYFSSQACKSAISSIDLTCSSDIEYTIVFPFRITRTRSAFLKSAS